MSDASPAILSTRSNAGGGFPGSVKLTVRLLSDATFGRGEGTAGDVDTEVEHDDLGLPFIGGKTLHGLLRDAWLSMECHGFSDAIREAGIAVFGVEASTVDEGLFRVGDAVLDERVRAWATWACGRTNHPISQEQILQSLTDVRRQTSEDREWGAPEDASLRRVRVVLRGTEFYAPIAWRRTPSEIEARCLARAVLGVRHAGLARNRGRGHVMLFLHGDRERTCREAKGSVQ